MKFELIEGQRFDLSGERIASRSISAKCCCFVGAAAAVAVAAIAVGASAYAASASAGAQEDANKANQENAKNTNLMNKAMFDEGRGSRGSAIYPTYAKDAQGNLFEPQLFKDSMGVYDVVNALPPQNQLSMYTDLVSPLSDTARQAAGTVEDIYNGGLEKEAIANQQPVNQGRQAVANSSLTALAQTLNDIKAINARKGYSGDSFGTRLLQFNARKNQGEEMAQANLANAIDERGIHNQAMLARINNVGLPYAQSQQALRQATLPTDTLLDQQARRQQLFNNFRIGTNQFQYSPLPQVQPVASTGQIVGQAIASGASAYGGYMAAGNAANTYAGAGNYGSYGNPQTRTPFQQNQFQAAQQYYS
jgi:hypothetical protein